MRKIILALLVMSMFVLAACAPKMHIPELGDKSTGDKITVFKSTGCGCCGGYIRILQSEGFNVETVETENIVIVKEKYNVPMDIRSCHTAFVNGYFIEGHVPVEAVNKLLADKPDIDGIVLDGMPPGSPGMPGEKTQPFTIYAVKDGEASEYMKI
jgi:hypothetical protein